MLTPLTVSQLANILNELVAMGKGDKVVLVPDDSPNTEYDYRTIGEVDAENDIQDKFIYLETLSDEAEEAYWEDLIP